MKKPVAIILFFLIQTLWSGSVMTLSAQVLVNKGSVIFSSDDIIFANGGVSNLKDSVTGLGGTFRNSGLLYVKGDWTNSAGNAAFTDNAGTNGNSTMTCIMFGGNQNIQGTDVTEFYNLNLQGSGVKQLNGINAVIKDTLDLNDREFATGVNNAYVTSTATTAIQLSTGFVSSLNGGALIRSTALPQAYLFPVGSSLGTPRYRPVEITPTDGAPNDFAVRLANDNATAEGYNVNTKKPDISYVNPMYYHQIRRDAGSSTASITIYYDESMDGSATGIGHWQNAPQWEYITSDPTTPKYGLSAMNAPYWDFAKPSEAFSLIKLLNECGEMFVPNAFSPDNNGENDMECVYGKCVKSLIFVIYDRWGEKVFESTSLNKCWDGNYNGKEMGTAVFVYYLRATLTTGEEVVKKGNISLFR